MKQDNNKNIVRFIGIKQYFPALHKAVSAPRLFIISILFIPLLSFGAVYKTASGTCNSASSYWVSGTVSTSSDKAWVLANYGPTGQMKAPYGSIGCQASSYNAYIDTGAHWNSVCFSGVSLNVACPTCQSGSTWDGSSQTCKFAPLPTYDNDPSGCSKAGGYFMSTGTEQVGGTSYGASFFGGAGIQLGGSLKATTKCGTLGDLAGQLVTTAIGLVPFASSLIGSAGMKKLANLAWIDKLQKYNLTDGFKDLIGSPKGFNDTSVGLPKVNPTAGGKPSVPITESAVPSAIKSGDTVATPTRAPTINVDHGYEFIQNAVIPSRANGDTVFDMSVVDLVNDFNSINRELTVKYNSDPVKYSYLAPSSVKNPAPLTQVVPKTFTYTKPVKETVDFSKYISDTPAPSNIANYSGTTNLVKSIEGTTPVDTYTTTKIYPDGSKSTQVVRIVPSTNTGSIKTTTLSYDGVSNTVTAPISVVGYVSPTTQTVPDGATITIVEGSPLTNTNSNPATPTTITNPDSSTTTVYPDGSTVTKDAQGTVISSTPATITTPANTLQGQDYTTMIDAKMPDYSYTETGNFVDYVSSPVTDMIDGASLMFSNISNQLSATKQSFDNTKALLEGKWQPPVMPAGSCGTFMSFDFHNRHVDLCPPLSNATSQFAPVVTNLVAVSGMAVSVVIIFGGL